jgi:ATP phosphoribosyltransferase
MKERLRIAIPNGELEKGVLGAVKSLGLEFQEPGREYLIFVENMPVDFVVLRASDIPSFVTDDRSSVKAGVTGSDILWEAGFGKNAGMEIPYQNRNDRNPGLFIGVTEDFAEKIQNESQRFPTPRDLANQMLATKFPNIANEYLVDKQISNVRVERVAGKIEAMQHVYWDCVGLIDVVESGRTRIANQIIELDRFYEVTVRMIEAVDRLNSLERGILEDLKEKIWRKSQELAAISI